MSGRHVAPNPEMSTISVETSPAAVSGSRTGLRSLPGWVRAWLWCVVGLVVLMVMVGGATRLTGSGLSITQWRPVTGALPPLSAADWAAEFARYRDSPQYQILNAGMSLTDFQSIYWWEWGHRQLGRFIGFVYAAGFVLGLVTRAFPLAVGARLALMGLLLGFQGLIGWVMVASGLKPGMTAVEPVDLAAHLLLASLFLGDTRRDGDIARAGRPRAIRDGAGPNRQARCLTLRASAPWLSKLLVTRDPSPDRARRPRRGLACGPRLQHLADHGWPARPAFRRAFRGEPLVGQSLRERDADPARSPVLRLSRAGACAMECGPLAAARS